MAKRIADKELTDRNWDQEDEGEEAGTFSLASEDVLKSRPIKKAKRRNPGAEGDNGGAFKGFKGFAMTPTSTPTPTPPPPAFSGFGSSGGFKGFGSGLANGGSSSGGSSSSSAPVFGGFSSPPASAPAPAPMFNGSSSTSPSLLGRTNGSGSAAAAAPSAASAAPSRSREYARQLTALNCSVRDWINKHVNGNPLCDLNPIFRDYERHLLSIERQYGAEQEERSEETPTPPSSSSSSSSLFGKATPLTSAQKSSAPAPPTGVTFNFGQKVDGAAALSSSASFSFSASSAQSSVFGSGSSLSLPFGGKKPQEPAAAAASTEENGEDECEEPPKPEVKEVKEEDAFFSKKCKLFYKKEAEFKEKGVGTLHLKRTAEGKVQMIIRADTNLGNILLNILVPASMPCSRMGKNNVMVVCVPNPPLQERGQAGPTAPVPLLIRVKTAEDADELHRTLEEHKN